ncbi:MAG: KpsF/GutQ family sugar-phosphate isomerase [bacterium]
MTTDSINHAQTVSTTKLLQRANDVIYSEIAALQALPQRLDQTFVAACEALLQTQGRVIVMGMGKSGHIGNKIAATLASTGTPAFFVHPAEASHGDLGMITPDDVVIALSNSGSSAEILVLLPLLKQLGVVLIAMTGNPQSALAHAAHFHLDVSVDREACPLNLAPTTSTTATLVMGDALAITVLEARGFTANDFARSHPGGRLGKRLLVHVRDIMHSDAAIPRVSDQVSLQQAILEITSKGLGITAVLSHDTQQICGVFTDGDLRRAFEKGIDLQQTTISEVMTRTFHHIQPDQLATDALNLMEHHAISALPVMNRQDELVGILHLHDVLRSGIV